MIAQFEFTGNDYADDAANTTGANTGLDLANSAATIGGVSVTDIMFSPLVDETAALGFAANDYDGALGLSTDVNSDRDFGTADQTIFFRFTVPVGSSVDLDELSFESLKTRGNNATGSRVTHTVFVNPLNNPAIDGLIGDSDFIVAVNHDHEAPPGPDDEPSDAESTGENFTTGRWQTTINLTSQTNLTGTNTIAFRSYASEGLDRDFGLDTIVLRGTVTAVPEPSSCLFVAAMLCAPTIRRRRRNQ